MAKESSDWAEKVAGRLMDNSLARAEADFELKSWPTIEKLGVPRDTKAMFKAVYLMGAGAGAQWMFEQMLEPGWEKEDG